MLEQIEAKLKEVSDLVFYGAADDVGNGALWNYIVFFRDSVRRGPNNTTFTDYYTVGIIHENWVPDAMIDAVIEKLETLPGVRLSTGNIEFNYSRKPSTNAVIEVATLTFCKARKRVL